MYSKRIIGPVEVRVWGHIDRREPDDCWLWTASVDRNGYGQVNDGRGRTRKAHQIVLEIKIGRPLTHGELGLHTCDTPPCCNPAHLYAGSHTNNARDMYERGRAGERGAKGTRNCNAKLTENDVREIRRLCFPGAPRGTQARTARQFGISTAVLSKIVLGQMWRHVT